MQVIIFFSVRVSILNSNSKFFDNIGRDISTGFLQWRDIDKTLAGSIQLPGNIHTLKNPINLIVGNDNINDFFLNFYRQPQYS